MAAASLHGSSIPLDAGGFVVTVVCPNAYSHSRLMQALNAIVPDAGEPLPIPPLPEDRSAAATPSTGPSQRNRGTTPPIKTQTRTKGLVKSERK